MPEEEKSERILSDEEKERMDKYKRKLELNLLTNQSHQKYAQYCKTLDGASGGTLSLDSEYEMMK